VEVDVLELVPASFCGAAVPGGALWAGGVAESGDCGCCATDEVAKKAVSRKTANGRKANLIKRISPGNLFQHDSAETIHLF
jgi:hypothetical protein